MAELPFDAASAVHFDLSRGRVADATRAPVVLVPLAAVDALARAVDASALRAFGRAIGQTLGARIASRFGGAEALASASIETALSHVAGELAVSGIGALSFERWGRALVLVLERTPLASDVLVEAVLASALGAAAGRDVACAVLAREGDEHTDANADTDANRTSFTLRLFVGREPSAEKLRAWVSEGVPLAMALSRLQAGDGAGGAA
jgi:hypothetical protein